MFIFLYSLIFGFFFKIHSFIRQISIAPTMCPLLFWVPGDKLGNTTNVPVIVRNFFLIGIKRQSWSKCISDGSKYYKEKLKLHKVIENKGCWGQGLGKGRTSYGVVSGHFTDAEMTSKQKSEERDGALKVWMVSLPGSRQS